MHNLGVCSSNTIQSCYGLVFHRLPAVRRRHRYFRQLLEDNSRILLGFPFVYEHGMTEALEETGIC